jgi:hypothetical protein
LAHFYQPWDGHSQPFGVLKRVIYYLI